jgi:hypothetical protein
MPLYAVALRTAEFWEICKDGVCSLFALLRLRQKTTFNLVLSPTGTPGNDEVTRARVVNIFEIFVEFKM